MSACNFVSLWLRHCKRRISFVSFIREEGTLELVTSQQRSFSILCADEEHKGVLTAVHNLQEDFYKVADIRPALVADAKQKGSADGQMYVFLLVLLMSLHS